VVRADVLKRLCTILESNVGNLSIKAHCSDGVQRDFADVEALIDYDNVRSREISRLGLDSRSDDFQKQASVRLSSGPLSSVDFSFTAQSDKLVVEVRQDVLALINELRPWYGIVATVDTLVASLVAFTVLLVGGVVGLLLGIALGFISVTSGSSSPSAPIDRRTAAYGLAVFALVGLVWALSGLKNRLFPVSIFAIGEGLPRHQSQETWRWVVVVGFLVSLVASLVGSLSVAFFR
jgi:hypothetical protein